MYFWGAKVVAKKRVRRKAKVEVEEVIQVTPVKQTRRKAAVKVDRGPRVTVKSIVEPLLIRGYSNSRIIKAVLRKLPHSRINLDHMYFYRGRIKKEIADGQR